MKRGTALAILCVMLVLCLTPVTALGKAKQMNDGVPVWTEETVRQYMLDYIGGKDMSRLWGYYDLQIRRYMPLSAFESFLVDLEWMTGDFLELGSYYSFQEPDEKLMTHVLHLCMEKQDLDLYFTHKDKEDDWEVMAVQFVPADKQNLPGGKDMLVADDGSAPANVTYTETEITIGEGGATPLKGILTLPQEAAEGKRVPACVLVHDKDALDRNSAMGATTFFADLAHNLANMGIASIRYDKRTYTYGEDESMTAWEETVEDAILAGNLLRQSSSIDISRLVLIGHGFGAMLAPRIALQANGVFTAMVLIGGSPKTYAQFVLDGTDLSGYSSEEKKALKKNVAELAKMDESAARALTLFGRNGYYYWEMAQYDAVKIIKTLKMPTYIIQGNRDPIVSVDDGWRLYSEEIGDGITYVSFKAFRGLNHILMNDLSTDAEGVPRYEVAASLDKPTGRTISQWVLSLFQTEEAE